MKGITGIYHLHTVPSLSNAQPNEKATQFKNVNFLNANILLKITRVFHGELEINVK